mmetsp:Transcript_12747/g.20643  ORF Transcript_12747/g.20643 Transcript_12747/m.20643 type:complete len:168 (-) Transcript_12747:632-1135(-)|eukprot:CAMPEP_0181370024 /NCGR_PEP_ID=MMETSP1106-20121128/13153_1 /TAXON_ID=81844 /ORGANISM="Mantoniella antarctica, Strain SL-175" /LENGTH=167 /DNA_ID=CAMNT_0023486685 /DNA_START=320 /DNA_END=823 /DNA_ORIENTATION=-
MSEKSKEKPKDVSSGTFYGGVSFDPLLTIGQILTMQCLFYLSLAAFLKVTVGFEGLTLGEFFDSEAITTSTTKGWLTIGAFCCAAFTGSGFLCVVIGRAKKCLDFAATVHILHLINCTVFGGVPLRVTWWVVTVINVGVMAIVGECLCFQRELREIPLTRRGSQQEL